jgi:hypothetical protein
MMEHQWDATNSILTVRPQSPLSSSDFAGLADTVDPVIKEGGDLTGLIIDAPHFPGWDSFGALVNHIRFVHDHHKHVKKIAVVTDSPVVGVAQHLAKHFVAAQIRQFPAGQVQQAQEWIADAG